jgi:DNA polymerase-1
MDASAFIHRAFHAMGNLTGPQGQPTGAIFGFANSLLRLLKDKKPPYLAVIFDSKTHGRRHALYPQYKANRPPMDPALIAQQEPIRELTRNLGLYSLEMEGFEADDVIATLCQRMTNQGQAVVIVSGDKDFYQLLSDQVSMYDPNPKKKSALTAAEFRAEFGLEPTAFLEMQGLMGDSSDNIPGAPKVGIVTAKKLIAEFGSLEGLYQNLAKVKSETTRQTLSQNEAQVRLSYELARLGATGVPEIDLQELKPQPPALAELNAFFKKYALSRLSSEAQKLFGPEEDLLSHLPSTAAAQTSPSSPQTSVEVVSIVDYYRYVLVGPAQWPGLLAKLTATDDYVALDLETDSLTAHQARIVGLSLALAPNEAYYLPFGHEGAGASQNLSLPDCLEKMGPILKTKKLLGQNAKFDWLILARHGLSLPTPQGDPMLASYLLDPDSRHGLDHLSQAWLGHQAIAFKDLSLPKNHHFGWVDLERALNYAAEDADLTWRLAARLREELEKSPALLELYDLVELPLSKLLVKMEGVGVLIDQEALAKLSVELEEEMTAREKKIYAMAGRPFNIASPKQLSEVLFQDLGLSAGKKTAKKTSFSTDSEVLKDLALSHPIASEVLAWREGAKLKNTYVDKLPLSADESGRVHTTYNQTQTATGRLSSSDPNLQNIPARSQDGQRIRAAFIAPPGRVLVGADYSQIELRIMAHFSQDQAMLEAFKNHEDIHAQTAAKIFGLNPGEVTGDQRRQAKTINFGVIYGQGAFGLAKQLGVPQAMAQKIIDDYFKRFPGIKSYMDRVSREAQRTGRVETWFGRRRYLSGFELGGFQARREAERMAINTPIQGTAADLIKMAMLEADAELSRQSLRAQILLQVHDELVVETPVEESQAVSQALVTAMAKIGSEPPIKGPGPMLVELSSEVTIGPSWARSRKSPDFSTI